MSIYNTFYYIPIKQREQCVLIFLFYGGSILAFTKNVLESRSPQSCII